MAANPVFKLSLNGREVGGRSLRHLLSVELTESMDSMDALSVQMMVPSDADEVLSLARVGVPFVATLQDGEFKRTIDGDIVEVSHARSASAPWTVSLRGLDGMHRLKCTGSLQRCDGTHSEVVREIAKRNQLKPEVEDVNATFDEMMQLGSDAETLHSLARKHNYIVRVQDGCLRFMRGSDPADTEPIVMVWGENLDDVQISWHIDGLQTEMEGRGYDHERNQELSALADARDLRRISQGPLGVELAQKALGRRPGSPGRSSSGQLTGVRQQAISDFQREAEQFLTGTVNGIGCPQAQSGRLLELRGAGPLSGRYLIRETRHSFGSGVGYRSSLSIVSDSLPPGFS